MSNVLVIGDDEKVLAAALKKHGAENVWWAVREGPATRPIGLRLGVATHHYAGIPGRDCSEEDYGVVIGGVKSEPKPESKKESKPAASKKATVKKDD